MDEEDVELIYHGILLSHLKNKKQNTAICSNMDGPRDCHAEWSKSDKEGEISYDILHVWNLKRNDTNELTYKRERDS